MNCQKAKDISIVDFLGSQGITPTKVNSREFWYFSPLHEEKTPSFKVFKDEKHWKDHGTGHGGDIFKLIVLMFRVNESYALQILSNQSFEATRPHDFLFSTANKDIEPEREHRLIIDKIQALQNRALLDYVKSRNITISKACLYLQEAYYHIDDKRFFAVAFKNDSGGYELRNKFKNGKNGSSPKTITTITIQNSDQVSIFEGFFDFLSALEYFGLESPNHNTIVLNSLSHLPLVMPILTNYSKINLFLDNDQAGTDSKNLITSKFQQARDHSINLYPGHKDFNEFLNSTKR